MSASQSPMLVALGEPMIEFNQARGDDPSLWLQGYGGDTSNMAIAAARLSRGSALRVAYVTRVGDDAFGRMFLNLWAREHVDATGVGIDADAPTAVYFVSHDANGHAFSYLRAGSAASRMSAASLPMPTLRQANALHVSGISQAISTSACDASFAAIDVVRQAGGRISYDPNLRSRLWPIARARAIVCATIPLADWVTPSYEDARELFGAHSPDAIVDMLHGLGARLVVLKLGADGCLVSDGVRRERIAGRRVDAVDATGAGDCFDGAFAVRLMQGDDAFWAATYANAAAALATTGYGAVAPLPDDAAVRSSLAEGSA
jgi:2-dehydro-3-deoxygluconokinase